MMSQSPNRNVSFSFGCVISPSYFPCDCDCVSPLVSEPSECLL